MPFPLPDLTNYVNTAKSSGKSNSEIISELTTAGWQKSDIDKCLSSPVQTPVPKPPMIYIYSLWDSFEHILLFISLYIFASSVALLLHLFVDTWVPGVNQSGLSSLFGVSGSKNILYSYVSRGYLASIIVSYPLFAYLFLTITKKTLNNPVLRQLDSRKKLIYLTLVGTFIIALVNVISIVFGFLSGNVNLNFILHFLVTTGISLIIFIYYLNQVKEDRHTNA